MDVQILKSLLYNVCVREPHLKMRYYCKIEPIFKAIPSIIFMADGREKHGGLVDRFKGIVTAYALSKVYKMPFYINYVSPFHLDLALLPNQYQWSISPNKICYNLLQAKILIAYSEYKDPFRLFRISKQKQNHIYYGYNSLSLINLRFGTDFVWGELFQELFKPSSLLQNYINCCKKNIGGKYIAIQFRFVHLLGDDINDIAYNKTYSDKEKRELIHKCRNVIQTLLSKEESGVKALVTSDSNIFIDSIQNDSNVYVIPGKVIHVDNQIPTDDSELFKPFIDFYLISEAKKVFSIRNKDMYPSGFPEYAAKVKSKPFQRITV